MKINNKYKTVLVVLITMLMIASAVPSISENVDKLAVSASTAIQTRVPQKQAFAVNKNPSITIAGREVAPMKGVINPVESSHAALLAATPVFPGAHPAVASDMLGNVVLGFENDTPNVWFTASLDGGQAWADKAAGWNITEPPELPDVDSCGDGRFIGGMVPSYLDNEGSALYKVEVSDPGVIPDGYSCPYWIWEDVGDGYTDFDAIACASYTAEDSDENTWAYGGHTIIGDHGGSSGEDTIFFSYQFNADGDAWMIRWEGINGCTSTSMDIDQETLYSYAIWNFDNEGTMDLYVYVSDFGTWEPYQSYVVHPDVRNRVIETTENDDYIDISALNDNVIIVSQRDGNIVAYYSTDGMANVTEASSAIETGAVNPRIVHTGDDEATCTFIKGNSVYHSSTEDGGATWSTPKIVDEPENAFVPEEHMASDVCGFGAAWMNSDDGNIYFGRIGNAPPEFSNENPSNGEIKVPITLSELNVTMKDLEGDSFNWTIETSPDIGSSSGTGEGNGTKICNISGLEYNTTYTWYVNATDTGSEQTASAVYNFTTKSPNEPPVFSDENPSDDETKVPITLSELNVTMKDLEGDSFNWSIETSPDIGSSSGTGEGNGTKICNISGLEYNTTYTWYVNATDTGSGQTASENYTFTTEEELQNNPPYEPSNESPSNGATNVDINADLSWTGGDPDKNDTVTYDVYLYPEGPGTHIKPVAKNISETTYDPEELDHDTKYYWKIVAKDNHGAKTPGPVWNFTTRAHYIPDPPTDFIATTINRTCINLSWTNAGDNETYIEWNTTETWNRGEGTFLYNGTDTSYSHTNLDFNTQYFYQAWSYNQTDNVYNTTYASANATTDANQPPYMPSDPNPENVTIDIDKNADLSWTGGDPDGDTVTYDVYFGNISSPPKVVSNQSTTTYEPGTLEFNTTYYWKIVAWDNYNESNASSIWSFTTEKPPNKPPKVKIIKPEKRAIYINNEKILPRLIRMTLIIGDITIEVNAADEDSGIEKVEFVIKGIGTINHTSYEPNEDGFYTYTWTRDRFRFIHLRIIEVVAYDKDGATAKQQMMVRRYL